jgi:putative transposase
MVVAVSKIRCAACAGGLDRPTARSNYLQSNGKQERFFRSLKEEALDFKTLSDPDTSRKFVDACIPHYNHIRLHSALGYVTPWDFLEGKAPQIHALRDQRLEQARELRKLRRQAAREPPHALA